MSAHPPHAPDAAILRRLLAGEETDLVDLFTARGVLLAQAIISANGTGRQKALDGALLLLATTEREGWKRAIYDAEPDGAERRSQALPTRRMADVEAEAVSFLWHPYIPLGKLTLAEGDPGLGKSWLSLAIAAALSLGAALPGAQTMEPATTLLLSCEDGAADTLRPRLDALSADLTHIYAHDQPFTFDALGLERLRVTLETVSPRLVVIDPLVGYLGAGVDIHKANEVRFVMAALSSLAMAHGCAMLCIRHLSKSSQGRAIYRGIGSIDFTGAARSVLLIGEEPNSGQRAVVHIKSNLALKGESLGYEIRDGAFEWTGKSTLTAADLLGSEESSEPQTAVDEAEVFLTKMLAGGEPVPQRQIDAQSKSFGISPRTLRRAREALGVVCDTVHEEGKRGVQGWTWRLPPKP